MTDCRYCGHSGAYDSGFSVECINKTCSSYCEAWAAQSVAGRMVIKKRVNQSLTSINTPNLEVYDALIPHPQWILTIVPVDGDTRVIKRYYSNFVLQSTPYLCKDGEAQVYRPSEDEILHGLDLEIIPCGKATITAVAKENTGKGSPLEYVLLTDVTHNTQLCLWHTQEQFDRYNPPSPVFSFSTRTGRLSGKYPNLANNPKP